MTTHTRTKPWLFAGLIVLAAVSLALTAPAPAQEQTDKTPAPPTSQPAEDEDKVDGDWGPAVDEAPSPWQRRRPRRFDDDGDRSQRRFDRRRPGADRPGSGGDSQRRPGTGRGMGRADRPGTPGQRGPMMSAEYRQRLLDVLKDLDPEIAERLEKKSEEDPRKLYDVMRRFGPRVHRLVQLKESDTETYQLSIKDMKIGLECDKLSRQYRKAKKAGDDDRAAEIRALIADQVEEHFDIRQKSREAQLERLERRLAEARKQLEKRADQRPRLIKDRISDLTGEDDEPQW